MYGDKMHHKFAVIENKTVITCSFNWSPSAAHTNDETLLVIHSPQFAQHFTREMDRLWRGAELGITKRMRDKLKRQQQKCGSGAERSWESEWVSVCVCVDKLLWNRQSQSMRAILSIIGASCLSLASGCANIAEITEGFKPNQARRLSKPEETTSSRTEESPNPIIQTSPEIQAKNDTNQPSTALECIVLDTNDTYANARRTPNGAIIGPLANGTRVQVIGELNEPSGRPWSEVSFGSAGSTGYVFKKLLTSCK